ncbi:MAG: hypothetical protein ACRDNZ_02695 [Streptosporangiaceae bacterium]
MADRAAVPRCRRSVPTAYKREVIADGISRRQLVALIADAADWLRYTGKDSGS